MADEGYRLAHGVSCSAAAFRDARQGFTITKGYMKDSILLEGTVTGAVRAWLKLEGLSVLLLSILIYRNCFSSWWMFFGLLLLPDLSMLAYLVNPRVGSVSYNIVHSYVAPVAMASAVLAFQKSGLLPYICIWTAHIGMDRLLGYGLKYPAAFGSTHLGMLGKRKPAE